jgi:DNA-binding NarL/FixJ family response regulator
LYHFSLKSPEFRVTQNNSEQRCFQRKCGQIERLAKTGGAYLWSRRSRVRISSLTLKESPVPPTVLKYPSELRIAMLAAEGATNVQIAQALFVGPKAVERHLTTAFAKLEISSRSELASALDQPPAGGAPGTPFGR